MPTQAEATETQIELAHDATYRQRMAELDAKYAPLEERVARLEGHLQQLEQGVSGKADAATQAQEAYAAEQAQAIEAERRAAEAAAKQAAESEDTDSHGRGRRRG